MLSKIRSLIAAFGRQLNTIANCSCDALDINTWMSRLDTIEQLQAHLETHPESETATLAEALELVALCRYSIERDKYSTYLADTKENHQHLDSLATILYKKNCDKMMRISTLREKLVIIDKASESEKKVEPEKFINVLEKLHGLLLEEINAYLKQQEKPISPLAFFPPGTTLENVSPKLFVAVVKFICELNPKPMRQYSCIANMLFTEVYSHSYNPRLLRQYDNIMLLLLESIKTISKEELKLKSKLLYQYIYVVMTNTEKESIYNKCQEQLAQIKANYPEVEECIHPKIVITDEFGKSPISEEKSITKPQQQTKRQSRKHRGGPVIPSKPFPGIAFPFIDKMGQIKKPLHDSRTTGSLDTPPKLPLIHHRARSGLK